MTKEIFEALTVGLAHSFQDALPDRLPFACIGVYTIWHGYEFVYVGIAGRNLDIASEHKRMRGVRDRLDCHRSGRRSGDQFAVYACDHLVIPKLSVQNSGRREPSSAQQGRLEFEKSPHNIPTRPLIQPTFRGVWALQVIDSLCNTSLRRLRIYPAELRAYRKPSMILYS
jgi:hypothetical protein